MKALAQVTCAAVLMTLSMRAGAEEYTAVFDGALLDDAALYVSLIQGDYGVYCADADCAEVDDGDGLAESWENDPVADEFEHFAPAGYGDDELGEPSYDELDGIEYLDDVAEPVFPEFIVAPMPGRVST
jgi:hypothetical protein